MTAVSKILTYERIPQLGFKNEMIRWLGPSKEVHIQLVHRGKACVVMEGQPLRWVREDAWHRKVPSPTRVAQFKAGHLDNSVFKACNHYRGNVTTTLGLTSWWLIGRHLGIKRPFFCTDFVYRVLRGGGFPVTEAVIPSKLMDNLYEVASVCR